MTEQLVDLSDLDRLPPGPDPARADSVLVPMLAAGATIVAAAEAAGINERTVRRRIRDDCFRADLQRERTAIRRQLVARLVASSLAAVDTLAELAEPGNSDTIRLTAAKASLDLAGRHLAAGDLSDRIADLERLAGVADDQHR